MPSNSAAIRGYIRDNSANYARVMRVGEPLMLACVLSAARPDLPIYML